MSTLIDCPACKRQLRVPDEYLGRNVRCPTCGEMFRAPEPAASARPEGAAGDAAPAKPPTSLDVALQLELDDAAPAPPPPREPTPPTEEAPRRRSREPEYDDDDDDWDRPRRRRRRRDFEPCPRCDEDVRRGAVVCPYCGLDLEEQGDGYTRRARVRRDAEPHRGGTVQGLGIASLVLAIFYILPISLPLGIAVWVMGRRDLRKMENGEMDPDGRKKTKDGWLCGMVGTILTFVYTVILVGIIMMAITEVERQTASNRSSSRPMAVQQPVNPPVAMVPPGQNFSLLGPIQQPIFIKRGETQTVTITVQRNANFRGLVTVTPDELLLPDGVTITPDEIKVEPGRSLAVFRVTIDQNADLKGNQTIHFVGEDVAGHEANVQVGIFVTQ